MSPRLIVVSGKSAGRAISIRRGKLLVGRADDCDVRPLSEEVSRRHCAFSAENSVLFVEDLRSRNGTFVNGGRIEGRVQLADGDIVRIGSLELKVSVRGVQDPSGGSSSPANGQDDEVSRWLMADEEPAGIFDTTLAMKAADEPTLPMPAEGEGSAQPAAAPPEPAAKDATVAGGRMPGDKTNPAFVPPPQKKSAESSRAAAAEALKKFFGNR